MSATQKAVTAEERETHPPATVREAIDELVEAYAVMTNPFTIDRRAIARIKVLNAIAVLRAVEAGR
jgi:hypothetical protein